MHSKTSLKFWKKLTFLSVISGLAYSSWPLGYILNPAASKNSLASALEGIHQPYNWVFIGLDVLCSLILVYVAYEIWKHLPQFHTSRLLKTYLIMILLFSIGTIGDTLLPEHCIQGAANCPSWQHNNLLLFHGVLSILAAVAIFIALLLVWLKRRTWQLNVLIFGYCIFSLLSLYEAVYPSQGNGSQHFYLLLCSVWIALIPSTIYALFLHDQSKKEIS